MATISSTAVTSVQYAKAVHAGVFSMSASFNFTASSGDVVQMLKVPQGFRVRSLSFIGSVRRIGGGTANAAATIDIGDGDAPFRYVSYSASATALVRLQATGASPDGLNYEYSVNDTIDVRITGITGTGSVSQTVSLELMVMGDLDRAS